MEDTSNRKSLLITKPENFMSLIVAVVTLAAVTTAIIVYKKDNPNAAKKINAAQDKIAAVAATEGKKIETAVAKEVQVIATLTKAALNRSRAPNNTGVTKVDTTHLTNAVTAGPIKAS
jgi:hypothetical protein